MLKLIVKTNRWYDSLKEPKRFLIFFIPMIFLIIGMNSFGHPIICAVSYLIAAILLMWRVAGTII